jgi:hypothetical protein
LRVKFIRTIEHLVGNANRLPQAARELGEWVANGAQLSDPQEIKARGEICRRCEHWRTEPERCDKCKCLAGKLHLKTAKCPLGKW